LTMTTVIHSLAIEMRLQERANLACEDRKARNLTCEACEIERFMTSDKTWRNSHLVLSHDACCLGSSVGASSCLDGSKYIDLCLSAPALLRGDEVIPHRNQNRLEETLSFHTETEITEIKRGHSAQKPKFWVLRCKSDQRPSYSSMGKGFQPKTNLARKFTTRMLEHH
jgi:hypothetical protein